MLFSEWMRKTRKTTKFYIPFKGGLAQQRVKLSRIFIEFEHEFKLTLIFFDENGSFNFILLQNLWKNMISLAAIILILKCMYNACNMAPQQFYIIII